MRDEIAKLYSEIFFNTLEVTGRLEVAEEHAVGRGVEENFMKALVSLTLAEDGRSPVFPVVFSGDFLENAAGKGRASADFSLQWELEKMGDLAPAILVKPAGIHDQGHSVFFRKDSPDGVLEHVVARAAEHDDSYGFHGVPCCFFKTPFLNGVGFSRRDDSDADLAV